METEERQLNNYHTLPLNAKQNKANQHKAKQIEQTNKTKQINKMLYKISKNKL